MKIAILKGELGNYTQLEGAMAVSRTLDIEDIVLRNEKLRYLYRVLTGEEFEGVIPETDDPRELALAIIFNLPKITVFDHEELKGLNESLLSFIRSA